MFACSQGHEKRRYSIIECGNLYSFPSVQLLSRSTVFAINHNRAQLFTKQVLRTLELFIDYHILFVC